MEPAFLLSTTSQMDSLRLRNIFDDVNIHEEKKSPYQTFPAQILVCFPLILRNSWYWATDTVDFPSVK